MEVRALAGWVWLAKSRTTDCRHARALLSLMVSRSLWNKARRVGLGSSARARSSISCDSKDSRKTAELL